VACWILRQRSALASAWRVGLQPGRCCTTMNPSARNARGISASKLFVNLPAGRV
jgi:hypothetical protein